jgi:hypothetical protein
MKLLEAELIRMRANFSPDLPEKKTNRGMYRIESRGNEVVAVQEKILTI